MRRSEATAASAFHLDRDGSRCDDSKRLRRRIRRVEEQARWIRISPPFALSATWMRTSLANEEWKFLEVSTPLELMTLALLWW
jgi:hypothetical protein